MATKKAKTKPLQFFFLTTIYVVDDDFFNIGEVSYSKSNTMLSTPTMPLLENRDEVVTGGFSWKWVYKSRLGVS